MKFGIVHELSVGRPWRATDTLLKARDLSEAAMPV